MGGEAGSEQRFGNMNSSDRSLNDLKYILYTQVTVQTYVTLVAQSSLTII